MASVNEANDDKAADGEKAQHQPHCYPVSLICEIKKTFFLKLTIHLPFVPHVGMELCLERREEAGWWSFLKIESVEWYCHERFFECRVDFATGKPYDAAKASECLLSKCWEAT